MYVNYVPSKILTHLAFSTFKVDKKVGILKCEETKVCYLCNDEFDANLLNFANVEKMPPRLVAYNSTILEAIYVS